ncbi:MULTISPECIES: hydantoinase/oxoprolinase family protein [unclassified Chelatococcus]|uniref:hydantoinase/oxoprolinase family protein n=1 Tax=unclassified Chelatococcus TaxID=2638111 RepID=UPI001BCFA3AD|nr:MULTISPECIES: hydantoinase/oxoprolinase family protein [unclassified Chelatococcus]MBS7696700.1 hydantoinase/oxoprolinase family protein [Chelatococcus sp. YT9]MBX3555265.1 hydantoinase/oxoprolinase family protein [Chelatococcus sp.]
MSTLTLDGGATAVVSVDVGGTFTDIVVETAQGRTTGKVLTDIAAPERGVLLGVEETLAQAGVKPHELALFLHGTTLATNALIERKGAVTALLTTDGFRDSIEIGYEDRFSQYDLFIEKAPPLVPRALRFTVSERILAGGAIDTPLDEDAVLATAEILKRRGVESIAIGFLHSYANPSHERRARQLLLSRLPELAVTLSSEVCPEIREYERFTTATANAYVQPLMRTYLMGLQEQIAERGFNCPILLMTSGGGLTTIASACAHPIRLVESGPAGGAILAAGVAEDMELSDILSFDMGGTTAKICLIDQGVPQVSRRFEVDRRYHYMKGSGLPLRIPVIDMVEIGAGGGSIAAVDDLNRLSVGPESAGSTPGPVCYGRGGSAPTVTDANLILGKIDPRGFAGGRMKLDRDAASHVMADKVGAPLSLDAHHASHGIGEIVEENMANAARRHAVESGAQLEHRSLIAFGGSAPLHAARLAEKLGIAEVIIPVHAGVGSAIGFLRAPIGFEVVRSHVGRLSQSDPAALEAMLAEMSEEARKVVVMGAPGAETAETAIAHMRYAGQGHEIDVVLPDRPLTAASLLELREGFEERYRGLFGHVIPDHDIEFVDFAVRVQAARPSNFRPVEAPSFEHFSATPNERRTFFDPTTRSVADIPVYHRAALRAGATLSGPALVVEDETTTVVTRHFTATIDATGAIRLTAKGP